LGDLPSSLMLWAWLSSSSVKALLISKGSQMMSWCFSSKSNSCSFDCSPYGIMWFVAWQPCNFIEVSNLKVF